MSDRRGTASRPRAAFLLSAALGVALLIGCTSTQPQDKSAATPAPDKSEPVAKAQPAPSEPADKPAPAAPPDKATPAAKADLPPGAESGKPLSDEQQRKLRADILRRISERGAQAPPPPPQPAVTVAPARKQGAADKVEIDPTQRQAARPIDTEEEPAARPTPDVSDPRPMPANSTSNVTATAVADRGRTSAADKAEPKKPLDRGTARQRRTGGEQEEAEGGGCGGGRASNLTPPPLDAPQPKLVIKEREVTRDDVWRGQKVTFKFTFANEGKAPLDIHLKKG